jgi:hypothetical protein
MRIIAAFIAGLVVALGSTAAAGTTHDDDVRTTCPAWAKPRTYQCNVYAPNFDLMRVKLYEDGEYTLGVDYEPGWVERIDRPRP